MVTITHICSFWPLFLFKYKYFNMQFVAFYQQFYKIDVAYHNFTSSAVFHTYCSYVNWCQWDWSATNQVKHLVSKYTRV